MPEVMYFQEIKDKYPIWAKEALSVLQWIQSPDGIDVGCGFRSLGSHMYRVDKDPANDPHLVADAEDLSAVESSRFDFYWASHVIEHVPHPEIMLAEAARVVRPGGYVVLIVPDRNYTQGLDPTHVHEWTPQEFLDWREGLFLRLPGLRLVDFGEAAPHWSFRVVYQVEKDGFACPADLKPVSQIVGEGLQQLRPRDWGINPPRVATLGDHIRLTTGFGQVHRQVAYAFHRATFTVYSFGIWEEWGPWPGEFPFYVENTCSHDSFGSEKLHGFLRRVSPEVVWTVADPMTQYYRVRTMIPTLDMPLQQHVRPMCPIIAYFPIENVPIAEPYKMMIRAVKESGGIPVTYCKCGAEAIKREVGFDVEYLHHGVDHAPFRPYSEERRQELREAVGWTPGTFVVMQVARNKRTNRQPEIIRAAKFLKEAGHTDVVFYLHCDPHDAYGISAMQGTDLYAVARYYGVGGFEGKEAEHNMVLFPPRKLDQHHGVPYHIPGGWSGQAPHNTEARGLNFQSLSLIDRYNMADLYIDPSSVQGWSLPNGEAMACGLPIIATKDGFTREEILGPAAEYFEVGAIDHWQTSAELKIVTAEEIARKIIWAKQNRSLLAEMRERSLERAKLYKWKPTTDRFVAMVKELVGAP